MKVKILKNTVAAGKNVKAGSVLDLPDNDAKILLMYEKAERFSGKPKEEEVKPDGGDKSPGEDKETGKAEDKESAKK